MKQESMESVVAVFGSLEDAKAAVNLLKASDYPRDQISLVARSLEDETELHGVITHGDRTEKDAAIGGGMGGLLGFLVGAAIFWIPGVGPVVLAGPIAAGLTGGIVGALLGAMSGWGVPEDQVASYEDRLKQGKLLVVAHGGPLEVAEAHRLLESAEPEELHLHASASDDSPDIAQDVPELHRH